MDISDNLLCLFNGEVTEQKDSFVVEIPQQEVDIGSVNPGDTYRVAMLPSQARESAETSIKSATQQEEPADQSGPKPPVEEGNRLDVEIEDVGDQGDGIARVGPGYVVIVPGTDLDERVAVEITEARENMAFAEVSEHYDR